MRQFAQVLGPEGLTSDQTEKLLGTELDGPACALFGALREGHDPSDHERRLIWKFLSLVVVRSHAWFTVSGPHYVRRAVRAARRELKASDEYRDREDIYDDAVLKRYEQILRLGMYPLFLASSVSNPGLVIGGTIPSFTLLEAPEDVGFVLSDYAGRPYSRKAKPAALTRHIQPLSTPGHIVTFPIGPKHCIVASYHARHAFKRERASETQTRAIDSVLLTLAYRFVVFPAGQEDVFSAGLDPRTSPSWLDST
jgi:hypothetical protein